MKKLHVFAAMFLFSLGVSAQTIDVHKKDGTVVSYDATNVEYIGFTAAKSDPDKGNAPATAEAINLGLPSGTKWANMNVGAEKMEDYGLYFAWGETVGYGSDTSDGRSFKWTSYKWYSGSGTTLTKYCTKSSYGTVDNKTVLDAEDDAVAVNWGGDWRMPTSDEIKELIDNTMSEWTTVNGVYGMKFTSTVTGYTNKYIFFPAAGYRGSTGLYSQGSYGRYWSSSVDTDFLRGAYNLYFDSSNMNCNGYYRWNGLSVRAVLNK